MERITKNPNRSSLAKFASWIAILKIPASLEKEVTSTRRKRSNVHEKGDKPDASVVRSTLTLPDQQIVVPLSYGTSIQEARLPARATIYLNNKLN